MANKFKNYFRSTIEKNLNVKNLIILVVILIFLCFCGYEYYRYFDVLKDPVKVKNMILSYGNFSVLAFLLLQIIQVVAFFIPGEIIQIAGGYIYGAWLGGILSLAGITLGSCTVYWISRYFGKPLIDRIISGEKREYFDKVLKGGHINFIVFLLYLIPGIPKDVLGYICGISEISFKGFLTYSTLGRIPGIFISAYFGAKIEGNNKAVLIAIAVVMAVLFTVGVLRGEKIIKRITKKH